MPALNIWERCGVRLHSTCSTDFLPFKLSCSVPDYTSAAMSKKPRIKSILILSTAKLVICKKKERAPTNYPYLA